MAAVTPFHQSCWRLRAEKPVSPLARLADPADFGPLRDLIRRTVVLPLGSRFSDGSFRPVYAAFEQRTCIAEVIHHWTESFLLAGCPTGIPLQTRMLSVRIGGERFLDVRHGHEDLHVPDDYHASQQFGTAACLAGDDGILYRSVRDPGGACVAAIRPQVASLPTEHSTLRFVWMGDRFQPAS